MSKTGIPHTIENLRNQIRQHEHRYYVLHNPIISDKQFDDLMARLIALEEQHPDLKTADSPTQRVGGEPLKEFKNVAHKTPMLSLGNTYSVEEIEEWGKRVKKTLTGHVDYIVDPKLDGISLSLIYIKGILAQAITRGNGTAGEDITANARTVKNIPLKLENEESSPEHIEIRGEVYMNKASFDSLNRQRISNNEEPFANPRNAAAGSLKLLNPRITAQRKLMFTVHSKGFVSNDLKFNTHHSFMDFCRSSRFHVLNEVKLCASLAEVINYCKKLEEKRDHFDFEIDGAVIKIDQLGMQQRLGQTLKSPRWAIAFKFAARRVTTSVIDIVHQVGRTGVITPVAELKPVECGGVVIARATLHNYDQVKRLGISLNDRVLVERAGDVIPKIVKVVERGSKGNDVYIRPPAVCPRCKTSVIKDDEDVVAYRCPNPACPAVFAGKLIHFTSRSAMDIEGLGDSIVEQLIDRHMLADIADIYGLTNDDLLQLDLFAEKRAENVINAIIASKYQPLHKLLFGFGIRNVGENAAIVLSDRFKTLDALRSAGREALIAIPEIGPVMADSIIDFFNLTSTKQLINKLQSAGVNFNAGKKQKTSSILDGLTVVVTGEIQSFTRSHIEDLIREHGGKPSGSVSSKTDMVVIGEKPGSKKQKAEKLKVKTISAAEFMRMLHR